MSATALVRSLNRSNALSNSNHKHKIRFPDMVYLKLNKWKVKILKNYKWRELSLMCKTDDKTKQYYFFIARQNILPKLRKLALRKRTMSCKIIDFGGQKRNQIQQYFILVLWRQTFERRTKLKRRTHVKINLKTRNQIISSPRDRKSLLRRCERKMKVVNQKDEKNKPIILRSVVIQLC